MESMTEGPVGPTLRRLAVPMMGGMFAFMLFNLADTFYVGQLGGDELAAMAFTFPVVFVVMSVSAGLGAGASAVIARAAGAGRMDEVKRLSTHGILLAVVIVFAVSMLGLVFLDPMFRALGADGVHLELITEYMTIWFAGMVFVVVPMVGNAAIRALGDTKTPSRIMITAAVANIILDPLLIFGIGPFPRLELQGAAIATVIAFVVTFVAAGWVFIRREGLLQWPTREIRSDWRRVLHIGGPAAFTMMLGPLAMAWLTRLAADLDPTVVAALGVSARVEGMAILGINALGAVLTPFMGQNLGADRRDRIRQGEQYARRFSLLWGFGAAILIAAFGPWIADAFTNDPATAHEIRRILWIVPITYGAAGMLSVAAASANGLGRPRDAVVLNLFRLFLSVGLLATVTTALWGGTGLFIGIAGGNLLAGLFSVWWLRRGVQKCRRAEAPDADGIGSVTPVA